MIKNEIILVDEKDNQIGKEEKLKVHREGSFIELSQFLFSILTAIQSLTQKNSKDYSYWFKLILNRALRIDFLIN